MRDFMICQKVKIRKSTAKCLKPRMAFDDHIPDMQIKIQHECWKGEFFMVLENSQLCNRHESLGTLETDHKYLTNISKS